MRCKSKKQKKAVQNACYSVMPRKTKIDECKSSKRKIFPSSHTIIETVNLVEDSDEENLQEYVVGSLQVSTVNSENCAELSMLNNQISLDLEQSCFILPDSTFCENTFKFQNEKPDECGSGTPTTNQLGESLQLKDTKQVIEDRPLRDIITDEVNIPIQNEEDIKTDYYSSLSSETSTENDCTNADSDIVFVSQNYRNDLENTVIVIEDDDGDVFKNCSKKIKNKLRRKQRKLLSVMQGVKRNRHQIKKFNTCDNISGSNTLNRVGLREIVIDGSNIAFGHSNGEYFSVRGLYIAIEYFLKKGHKVSAFVPQFRLKAGESSCPAFLQELADKRYVIFTPSREVMGKRITPYDDRLIIQYAHIKEAIIVSNDNYRDLLLEKPEWQSTIENRLLMYTWVDDLLIFPEDPLGRRGPPLSDFLKFPN